MKFISRSLLILFALYGLVFAVGDAYLAHGQAPLWSAIVFVLVIIGIQYLISPWLIRAILDIDFAEALPEANRRFVEQLCAERGLKVPKIGVIRSGTPNAFSFGHVPSDSRVVVTTGLLEVLTPEEVNAVLAHEIGHIEHWDFAVMTIAALAPLLLYQIYVFTRSSNHLRPVAVSAYLCYWVSQFVVLMLNRTREYFADHYAAEVTHSPEALSSALIKIAYGMVKAEGEYQRAMKSDSKEEKAALGRERRLAGSLAVMGISNLHSGSALALSAANPAEAAAVMRWDLVNPWARLYELSSTHPLTALRVRALNQDAMTMQQAVQYPLPQERRRGWARFSLEVLLWAAPWLCAAVLAAGRWIPDLYHFPRLTLSPNAVPALLMFTGATWMLRIWYRYHGKFQDASVMSLIEDVEVSEMRPRAVRLKGEIVGRGVPGAFWSPDLVLRDATGMIFMLYRQTIPFARFFFAITEAEQYVGQEVEIEGWFRRGLVPYVEMRKLTGADGRPHRSYSRWVQYALALSAVIAGYLW
jgi:heat shock protein HtpX